MSEVKAVHVDDTESVLFRDKSLNKPGEYSFYQSKDRPIAGMNYVCPCDCGATGALDFRPHQSPSWNWDGNKESPTLTPSVFRNSDKFPGVCGWHGFLTNGVWRSV